MRRSDLLHLCLHNLLRRKARTILTILGMLIGCSSIVMMLSFGLGMEQAQQAALAELGDLTLITVTAPSAAKSVPPMDSPLLRRLQAIEGVDAVMPVCSLNSDWITVTTGPGGRYVSPWTHVVGVDAGAMQALGYHFVTGGPALSLGQAMIGEYFAYTFQDITLPEGEDFVDRFGGPWDQNGNQIAIPTPFFPPLEQTYTLTLHTDHGTVSLPLQPTGIVAEDLSKGSETSDGILLPMETLQQLIKQAGISVPNEALYDRILVKAGTVHQVARVEQQIKSWGYSTDSMESVRKLIVQEAQKTQLLLGSLGAVSLFIAALGILNTMMMAMSERSKEIGILKSLGCSVGDIRALFLFEAGAIGLIGGLCGCLFSLLVSGIINLVSLGLQAQNLIPAWIGGPAVTRLSVIPWWLLLFALVFSLLIGLGAGYYPANKAVGISVLDAIRRD